MVRAADWHCLMLTLSVYYSAVHCVAVHCMLHSAAVVFHSVQSLRLGGYGARRCIVSIVYNCCCGASAMKNQHPFLYVLTTMSLPVTVQEAVWVWLKFSVTCCSLKIAPSAASDKMSPYSFSRHCGKQVNLLPGVLG